MMLKKILMILGGVFLVQIVALAVGLGYFYFQEIAINKQSATYADEAAAAIAAEWSFDQLESRVHPQFFVATPKEKVEKTFKIVSGIGDMKSFAGCKGNANTQYTVHPGITAITSAVYLCSAEFENGPAVINLTLLKDPQKGWQIININVDSKFFASHANDADKKQP